MIMMLHRNPFYESGVMRKERESRCCDPNLPTSVLSDNLFHGSVVSEWIDGLYVPSTLWISGTVHIHLRHYTGFRDTFAEDIDIYTVR